MAVVRMPVPSSRLWLLPMRAGLEPFSRDMFPWEMVSSEEGSYASSQRWTIVLLRVSLASPASSNDGTLPASIVSHSLSSCAVNQITGLRCLLRCLSYFMLLL